MSWSVGANIPCAAPITHSVELQNLVAPWTKSSCTSSGHRSHQAKLEHCRSQPLNLEHLNAISLTSFDSNIFTSSHVMLERIECPNGLTLVVQASSRKEGNLPVVFIRL